MDITQDLVKAYFTYNPDTGDIYWRERDRSMFKAPCLCDSWNRRFAGKLASRLTTDNKGYRRLIVKLPDRKDRLAHRVIWLYMTGELPQSKIDHLNRDATDNRWHNLRATDTLGNSRNQSLFRTSSSRFAGVNWRNERERWRAQITIAGKHVHLGYYTTIIDAVAARMRANREYGFHDGHGQARPY